jgi:hypothetical protein
MLRRLMTRLSDRLFPRVCPACEGGSGYLRNPATGHLRRCTFCGGSGKPPAGQSPPPDPRDGWDS